MHLFCSDDTLRGNNPVAKSVRMNFNGVQFEAVNKMKERIYMQNYSYPNIDMQRTGALLKKKVEEAGYTVKELQEKLMLSCPQPIYRWFKGKVLPSINHLYA